jgi:hypothetical protein
MLRLAANSEFRESVARVTEEMKKAGVDLTSPVRWAVRVAQRCDLIAYIILQEVLQEVMSLQKTLGPK